MLKKFLCFLICFLMVLPFAGCKKKQETLSVDTNSDISVPDPTYYVNPLTGEKNLDEATALSRPVAIMVNNLSQAQSVQTGLNDADIIYETEVEGGITRLLAVYKDLKSVKQVGTVRSSRYVYIDLAAGHNAIYAYHGIDNEHAKPHLGVVDSIVVGTNNGGKRVSNGLASEHTLYADGAKLWSNIEKQKFDTELETEEAPWVSFADKDTSVKFDFTANTFTVPFSTSYKTRFDYNPESGLYTRFSGATERKDYVTGESITVKNVFVLNTTISDMSPCTEKSKGKSAHKNVNLTSGDGYYFVNGTYTKINWSKGSAGNGFTFTKEDGSPLTVNQGNSWVCIANRSTSQAVIG